VFGGEEGVKFPSGFPTRAGVIENVDSRVSSRKFMGNTIQGFLSWADVKEQGKVVSNFCNRTCHEWQLTPNDSRRNHHATSS